MNLTLSLLLPLTAGFGDIQPAGHSVATPIPPHFPSSCLTPLGPGPRQACPPIGPPASVLTSNIIAPKGATVTLFGGGPGKSFPAPVTAGFRPGYVYRFALSNLPNHPGETLYPALEVRGSLVPRVNMKPADFPAPIVISQSDIEKAFAGQMVTKIIYLENPERAVPAESRPNDPLEVAHDTEEDANIAARENGRLVAILRFGDRKADAQELAVTNIPGTVLMPGDMYLSAPGAGPCLPWAGVQLFDPILGPRPTPEECITDGGDKGPRLGIGPDGRVGGLNPTDVAVEYTQGAKRRVATSNEVCLCVPRFMVRRVDTGIARLLLTAGLEGVTADTGKATISNRTPAEILAAREKPLEFDASIRAAMQIGEQRVMIGTGITKLAATGTAQGVLLVASVVEVDELTSFPNQLVVTKEVDPKGPLKVGDVVTFTIRYRNSTRQPVSDLVVSDSLSARLEYVLGSAASDRPANVTTSENEVGSVVVRFELPGALPPGQGGVVTFRAKVR